MPDDIVIAEICERFGWTWAEYHDQPICFIDLIRGKMSVEAEHARRDSKH